MKLTNFGILLSICLTIVGTVFGIGPMIPSTRVQATTGSLPLTESSTGNTMARESVEPRDGYLNENEEPYMREKRQNLEERRAIQQKRAMQNNGQTQVNPQGPGYYIHDGKRVYYRNGN